MTKQLSPAEIKEVWQSAQAQLQLELSDGVYTTFISQSRLTDLKINSQSAMATINSASGFHSTNLKKNFDFQIRKVLSSLVEKSVEVEYKVGLIDANQASQKNQTNIEHETSESQADRVPRSPSITLPSGTSASPRVEDLFSESSLESSLEEQAAVRARNIGLRSDYNFETFAVSSSNEMAHAAATAVSEKPGMAYNPLFLYGGVGVGKTHLMHAIAHNILKKDLKVKIIYCTGEEFTNQIVEAIRSKKALGFKNRFRSTNVLLIDDIQFIAGKNKVQEEFFHTFNTLIKNQSQVVLTSDRPPHEISLLEDRLRSRFEAGLMIDIQQPSFELRTAIVLIKSKALGLSLPIETSKMIATRVDSARKIEGILNSIRSKIDLEQRELSPELIEEVLVNKISQNKPKLNTTIQKVIKTVADHYHLKQQVIKGKSRKKKITRARHVAMYICKEDLDESYSEIGRWFSNRDHSTVIHAYQKIEGMLENNQQMIQEVSAIRMSLSALS